MKQKNNRPLLYMLSARVLLGIVYVAAKDISPETVHVEKNIAIHK